MPKPFNPYDYEVLSRYTEREIAGSTEHSLPPMPSPVDSGVYMLLYHGPYALYATIAQDGKPIYIGKSTKLGDRLKNHADKLADVATINPDLDPHQFGCKYLIVERRWLAVVEGMLLDHHAPLWNSKWLNGFGNKNYGRRRGQRASLWDTLHPGWTKAAGHPPHPKPAAEIESDVARFMGLPTADRVEELADPGMDVADPDAE